MHLFCVFSIVSCASLISAASPTFEKMLAQYSGETLGEYLTDANIVASLSKASADQFPDIEELRQVALDFIFATVSRERLEKALVTDYPPVFKAIRGSHTDDDSFFKSEEQDMARLDPSLKQKYLDAYANFDKGSFGAFVDDLIDNIESYKPIIKKVLDDKPELVTGRSWIKLFEAIHVENLKSKMQGGLKASLSNASSQNDSSKLKLIYIALGGGAVVLVAIGAAIYFRLTRKNNLV